MRYIRSISGFLSHIKFWSCLTVPFRPQPKIPKGSFVWREVKVALFARLGSYQTKSGKTKTRLYQRRVVASLGDIDRLKPRPQLEALRQGITTASQVVWILMAHVAFGDFTENALLPKVLLAFWISIMRCSICGKQQAPIKMARKARTPQRWFASLRHRLRHSFGKGIIKELDWLSKPRNTTEATKPILRGCTRLLQAPP